MNQPPKSLKRPDGTYLVTVTEVNCINRANVQVPEKEVQRWMERFDHRRTLPVEYNPRRSRSEREDQEQTNLDQVGVTLKDFFFQRIGTRTFLMAQAALAGPKSADAQTVLDQPDGNWFFGMVAYTTLTSPSYQMGDSQYPQQLRKIIAFDLVSQPI